MKLPGDGTRETEPSFEPCFGLCGLTLWGTLADCEFEVNWTMEFQDAAKQLPTKDALNAAKGILIIAVVLGHARATSEFMPWLFAFLYLWHVQSFFILSVFRSKPLTWSHTKDIAARYLGPVLLDNGPSQFRKNHLFGRYPAKPTRSGTCMDLRQRTLHRRGGGCVNLLVLTDLFLPLHPVGTGGKTLHRATKGSHRDHHSLGVRPRYFRLENRHISMAPRIRTSPLHCRTELHLPQHLDHNVSE